MQHANRRDEHNRQHSSRGTPGPRIFGLGSTRVKAKRDKHSQCVKDRCATRERLAAFPTSASMPSLNRQRDLRLSVSIAAAIALRAASASAQRPTVDVQPSTVGDCLVVVNVRELTTAVTLEVQLDKNRIARADVQPPAGVITTLLKGPLEDGDEIRVIVGRDVVARATPRPLPPDVAPSG